LKRVNCISMVVQIHKVGFNHTTRAGGADRDGHPARVKARGGGRRAEEGKGAIFSKLQPYLKALLVFQQLLIQFLQLSLKLLQMLA